MPQFIVTMRGESREVYIVDAETEDEARENWHTGWCQVSEPYGMEVESVEEDR